MKPILIFLIIQLPFTLFGLNGTTTGDQLDNQPITSLKASCQTAIEMSCQTNEYFSGNFSQEALTDVDKHPECVEEASGSELHEFWIELNINSYLNYFLDGTGVNGGFEIYSGDCDNLQLIACEAAQGNSTYYAFYTPEFDQYYIRVFGYDFMGGSNYNMLLHCFSPVPTCDISIEEMAIAPCIDENGMVEIDLSGIIHGGDDGYPIGVEVLTDAGFYFGYGLIQDTLWSASILVSGSSITYISCGAGHSENYCSDLLASISLPDISCNDDRASLLGNVLWNVTCEGRSAKMRFYIPGTSSLIGVYNILVSNSGLFQIDAPAIGQFDMILKIDGFLPKGFSEVIVGAGTLNTLNCGTLIRGEVSGDNAVNVTDISLVNAYFGQNLSSEDPLQIDINCDGVVNVVDISVVSGSFGMVGDVAPF